ncbi:hypothetical protein MZM54_02430 [[Brevibacterium] frigoritolerans]|nr:hypothetical protein [Peribacillus frigoritolerans]
MNYPILYSSTYKMSAEELKRYIFHYNNHSVNYTLSERFRLISFHKYEDGLCIRLEWFISNEFIQGFKMPDDIATTFSLEKNGIITHKRGHIVAFTNETHTLVPNDTVHSTFHNVIRKNREPITTKDYAILEYPVYKRETIITDEQLEHMVFKYSLFREYLTQRNKKGNENENETR